MLAYWCGSDKHTYVAEWEGRVLGEKLGFKIIGEIPEAFNHKKLGLTAAFVMWRKL